VLVVGAIHGTERAGRPVVRLLLRRRPPAGSALWLVPTLNPDGEVRGTRQNAYGVDLNRNFPRAWRYTGRPFTTYAAGSRPASQPETRAMMRLVRRVNPTASVWYHQHMDLVYRQGGRRPSLLTRYARRIGMRVVPSPKLTGTAIRWQNARGGTAFVVELPAGALSARAVARHAAAALSLGRP
jgi:protein MpaA